MAYEMRISDLMSDVCSSNLCYIYVDTVINEYLIRHGGLDMHRSTVIGLCAESNCKFVDSLAFPNAVDAGLRVAHLGRSSVRYEIGLFGENKDAPAAEGWFEIGRAHV